MVHIMEGGNGSSACGGVFQGCRGEICQGFSLQFMFMQCYMGKHVGPSLSWHTHSPCHMLSLSLTLWLLLVLLTIYRCSAVSYGRDHCVIKPTQPDQQTQVVHRHKEVNGCVDLLANMGHEGSFENIILSKTPSMLALYEDIIGVQYTSFSLVSQLSSFVFYFSFY